MVKRHLDHGRRGIEANRHVPEVAVRETCVEVIGRIDVVVEVVAGVAQHKTVSGEVYEIVVCIVVGECEYCRR